MRRERSTMLWPLGLVLLLGVLSLACGFLGSSAKVTDAVTAAQTVGDLPAPGAATNTFTPEQDRFHVVVSVSDAPKNTKLRAVWTAPDGKVHTTEATVEGTRSIDLSVARSASLWTPGTYKVDIYLDGKVSKSLTFKVVGAVPSPTPTRTPTRGAPPTSATRGPGGPRP